jgi:hypothetical protein
VTEKLELQCDSVETDTISFEWSGDELQILIKEVHNPQNVSVGTVMLKSAKIQEVKEWLDKWWKERETDEPWQH